MFNGFFELKHIKDLDVLKQLFRDALEVSTSAHVDILHGWRRERTDTITPKEYIEEYITLHTHNVVIDRKAYYPNGDIEGEIGSSTLDSKSKYLFIYLSLEDLYNIVEKYNLPKQI